MQRARIITALTGSFAAEVVNRLVPLVILHVVVQRIGVAAFGLSDFSYRLIDIGIIFTVFGYTNVAALEIGARRDDPVQVGAIIGEVLVLKAVNALIALVALFLAVAFIPGYDKYQPFVAALSFIILTSALDLQFVHLGTSRMLSLMIVTIIVKLASLAAVVLLVHGPDDAIRFAVLNFGANAAIAVGNFALNARRFPIKPPTRAAVLRRFRASLPFALTVILMMALERYDFLIVEHLLGERGAGLYGGPLRLVQALLQVVGMIGAVFLGELVATRTRADFTRHVNVGLWAMYALLAPVCVGAFFLGSSVLSLVLGPEFASQGLAFGILTSTLLAQSLVNVYGMQVLLFQRRGALINMILFGATALGLLVAGPLSNAFGITGVALATLISRTAAGAAMAVGARAHVDRLPWREVATTALPALGMGVLLYLIRPATLGPALVLGVGAYGALFAASNRTRLVNLAATIWRRRQA